MSERETCAICGYHGCPGHLYYGNDCSVTFKTDNTAVIRTLEKRIAGLEAALSQSMGDHVDTGRALRLARAENQRLRAGLSEALDWNWLDDDAPDDSHLRALLGGGENG